MVPPLDICITILHSFVIIIHIIGIYTILSIYNQSRNKPQKLYLLNLCISRGCTNLLWGSFHMMTMLAPERFCNIIRPYAMIVSGIGLNLVWYLDLLWITFDRLGKFILKLNYVYYWNEKKARYLLVFTWFLGVVSTVCTSLSYTYKWHDLDRWKMGIYEYFHMPMDLLFIIVSIISYTYIFRRIRRRKRRISAVNAKSTRKRRQSIWYKKRIILIPILIIVIFSFFQTLPDLLEIVFDKNEKVELVDKSCTLLYGISNLANAVVYVYHLDDIQKFLIGKCTNLMRTRSDITSYGLREEDQRNIQQITHNVPLHQIVHHLEQSKLRQKPIFMITTLV